MVENYKGWAISYDYPPIPVRDMDWSATSPDYDCDGDSEGFHCVQGQMVHAATLKDLYIAIDEAIDENAEDA